jgi:hypothetical protein
MKRPAAIHILAGFYLLMMMASLAYLVSSIFMPGTVLQYLSVMWVLGLPDLATKIVILLYCLMLLLAVLGLWEGRPWGRNISFTVCLVYIFVLLTHITSTLKILTPSSGLYGWTVAQLYIELMATGVFLFIFYLGLRPEVGRFCKSYPS